MRRLPALLLLCIATLFGCGPRKDVQLYIYCNETFWYVMQEEALYFNQIHGFQVILIPVGAHRTVQKDDAVEINSDRRTPVAWDVPSEQDEQQIVDPHLQMHPDIAQRIEKISEGHFGDLFMSDSPRHLALLQNTALASNDYPVCYLTLTMLVPRGNPHHFRSVKDVLDSQQKLGIVGPAFDGLGEASWEMLHKIKSTVPMELVQIYERQYDLLEALEEKKIAAALVWNTSSQLNYLLIKYSDEYNAANETLMREAERKRDYAKLRLILHEMCRDLVATKSFAEEIPLTENPDERYIISVRLVALSSAFNFNHSERFADFMRSKQGKETLQRFGFTTE